VTKERDSLIFCGMPNPEFEIRDKRDGKLLRIFYTSDSKEVSTADKQKICGLLGISFESVWFTPTHEAIDSLQLPEKPTFKNRRGRKYWL
jgi:hypothetical protein